MLGYPSHRPVVTVCYKSSSAIRWPCSHCEATNHYPANCPFLLTLYLHPLISQDLPPQVLQVSSSSSPEDIPLSDQQPIMPLIAQSVTAQTAHSHTDVNSVPTTVLSIAPTEAVLVNKPKH